MYRIMNPIIVFPKVTIIDVDYVYCLASFSDLLNRSSCTLVEYVSELCSFYDINFLNNLFRFLRVKQTFLTGFLRVLKTCSGESLTQTLQPGLMWMKSKHIVGLSGSIFLLSQMTMMKISAAMMKPSQSKRLLHECVYHIMLDVLLYIDRVLLCVD